MRTNGCPDPMQATALDRRTWASNQCSTVLLLATRCSSIMRIGWDKTLHVSEPVPQGPGSAFYDHGGVLPLGVFSPVLQPVGGAPSNRRSDRPRRPVRLAIVQGVEIHMPDRKALGSLVIGMLNIYCTHALAFPKPLFPEAFPPRCPSRSYHTPSCGACPAPAGAAREYSGRPSAEVQDPRHPDRARILKQLLENLR